MNLLQKLESTQISDAYPPNLTARKYPFDDDSIMAIIKDLNQMVYQWGDDISKTSTDAISEVDDFADKAARVRYEKLLAGMSPADVEFLVKFVKKSL